MTPRLYRLTTAVLLALGTPVAASAAAPGERGCTPIPSARIGFQLATVMSGFMPPGATPLPSPDPARMRAGTANPPMPRLAPDPAMFRRYLKDLRAVGFRNMERFGGTLLLPDVPYRAILKDAGIRSVSSHGSLEEPEWSAELDRAQALGQDYVGSWGFGPIGLDSYEHVLATAANLERLGRAAAARGLRFMVHDHEAALRFHYPYDRNGDGRTEMVSAWEIVAARTDPRFVHFELDIHWALKALGSEDALVAFLNRHWGRIDLLHVKDMAPDGSVTDLGKGINDWPRIFAAAGNQVRYYIWEYERPSDPLLSAATAYRYLRCEK
ncbi:sugar phosphate isomerase/epimerase family protein [Sphingobium baderi]|uniref:sugar phosphate isomerase/epimerase family protein n=1 Tax=Sphingobium baderi TaxID=1332080 RepID=UPI002B4051F8|nr:sugar phosphate isomerase/epimerase [Sphingobium baderi]WRD76828.1 sugar phosphate isomerase/epimerase [Sphingobium baderi]